MKILIIGYGYVGKAMAELLSKLKPTIYDPYVFGEWVQEKKAENFDLAVVCVPTQMREDHTCDTSIAEKVIKEFNADLFLIKSTVTPGTTEMLEKETGKKIVFSPEYVGESTYFNPYFPEKMIETPFIIFGGDRENTQRMVDFFLPIMGPAKRYLQMTSKEAELVKYMENSFFALKITYCQEFYDLCQKMGVDWHTVREGWLADPRINPMHTAVFKDKRGFSGKCLPKDTNAIVEYAKKMGSNLTLLEATLNKNKFYTKDL